MDTANIDLSCSDNTNDDNNVNMILSCPSNIQRFESRVEGQKKTPIIVELQCPSDKEESKEEPKKQPKEEPPTPTTYKFNKADKWFIMLLVMYLLVGILTFVIVEAFTFIDSFYFRVVTLFHIGFGDIIPTTHSGKILNAIFIVVDMCFFVFIYWRIFYFLCTESINNKFLNVYYAILCAVVMSIFLFCGILVYVYGEGYTFVDAFSWSFDTILSIGYAHITSSSVSSKIFCIFYIIFGYLISLYFTVYLLYRLNVKYIIQMSALNSSGFDDAKTDEEKMERSGLLQN